MPAKKKTDYPSFKFRVSEEDLTAFEEAAKAEHLSIAAWIRRACYAAIDAMPKPKKR
jgi:predicted HicB family RNase H-like nuclease